MAVGVVILILMISAFFAKTDFFKSDQQKKIMGQQQEFLSGTPSSTPSSTPPPSPNPSPTSAKNSQTSQTSGLSDLKYPSSDQNSTTSETLILESNDHPDLITSWYKDKIRSLGFKSKSFVQTKTNGNILNKLNLREEDLQCGVCCQTFYLICPDNFCP